MNSSASGGSGEDRQQGQFPGSHGDRRASSRHVAICRIARVTRDGDIGLWRVRNISDDGVMLCADVAMTVGEPLHIALSETIVVEGKIMWTDRGRCGVALNAKIDVGATLHALAAEQRSERYRAMRLPVEAEAILVRPGQSVPIDLVDVSPQGAGHVCDTRLEPESELDIVLPGGELRRRAIVRWTQGNRGGLWFTQPLDRADLESMARFGSPGEQRDHAARENPLRRGFLGAAMSVWSLVHGNMNGRTGKARRAQSSGREKGRNA